MNHSLKYSNTDEERKALTKQMWEATLWWIQSYDDFIRKAWNNWKTKELLLKLKLFKENLEKENPTAWEIDPVCYLKRLYYLKWLSLDDIHEKIKGKWLYDKENHSLRYLFVKVFKWQIKDTDTPTEKLTNHRKTWPQVKKFEKHNNNLSEKNIKAFNISLEKILNQKEADADKQFKRRVFASFTGKRSEIHNKAFYLLECYSNITFEDVMKAAYESWTWFRTVTKVINTKVEVLKTLKNIDEDLTIKATTMWERIRSWKKKNTN